jgi:hypothetical protein
MFWLLGALLAMTMIEAIRMGLVASPVIGQSPDPLPVGSAPAGEHAFDLEWP